VDVRLIKQADLLVEGLEPGSRRILSTTFAGFPCALALSAKTSFSRRITSALSPDGSTACGLEAATCIAILRPIWASSSVLPLDSSATRTPILPSPSPTELCM